MAEGSGAAIVRRVALPLLAANVIGALVVFAFLAWVLPLPDAADEEQARLVNGIALAAGLALAAPLGFAWSLRLLRPTALGARGPRARPGGAARDPARAAAAAARRGHAVGGRVRGLRRAQPAARLPARGGRRDHRRAPAARSRVTCALAYLLAERLGRTVTELALAASVPDEPSAAARPASRRP